MTKQKIGLLSFFKAVAATLIVFHHYQQVFKCSFEGINFYGGDFYFGYLVEFFFIVSGFLTIYSAKTAGRSISPLSSFLHKVWRIIPLVTIALVFTLTVKSVYAVLYDNSKIAELWNLKTLIANFFLIFRGWPFFSMTGINNPTWYLCILLQCYIVFYAIKYIADKVQIPRLPTLIVMCILSAAAYRFVPVETTRGLECFFIGAALCAVLESDKVMSFMEKQRFRNTIMVLCAVSVLASVILIALYGGFQREILMAGVFPELVLIAYCLKSKKCKLFETLGNTSFAVYIWHYPFMVLETLLLKITDFEIARSYGTMIVFTIIIWIIGWCIYKYLEIPLSQWIKKREKKANE